MCVHLTIAVVTIITDLPSHPPPSSSSPSRPSRYHPHTPTVPPNTPALANSAAGPFPTLSNPHPPMALPPTINLHHHRLYRCRRPKYTLHNYATAGGMVGGGVETVVVVVEVLVLLSRYPPPLLPTLPHFYSTFKHIQAHARTQIPTPLHPYPPTIIIVATASPSHDHSPHHPLLFLLYTYYTTM